MARHFGVPIGLSDHTLDISVPIASVALGECIIEKHLTSSRAVKGPDSAFSLEPHEFKAIAEAVRATEKALGKVSYGTNAQESKSKAFRRSLFVVCDVKAGEKFNSTCCPSSDAKRMDKLPKAFNQWRLPGTIQSPQWHKFWWPR